MLSYSAKIRLKITEFNWLKINQNELSYLAKNKLKLIKKYRLNINQQNGWIKWPQNN